MVCDSIFFLGAPAPARAKRNAGSQGKERACFGSVFAEFVYSGLIYLLLTCWYNDWQCHVMLCMEEGLHLLQKLDGDRQTVDQIDQEQTTSEFRTGLETGGEDRN